MGDGQGVAWARKREEVWWRGGERVQVGMGSGGGVGGLGGESEGGEEGGSGVARSWRRSKRQTVPGVNVWCRVVRARVRVWWPWPLGVVGPVVSMPVIWGGWRG